MHFQKIACHAPVCDCSSLKLHFVSVALRPLNNLLQF